MKIEIESDGVWYHGSNVLFSELRTNSTITQWKALAEAFSHQPSVLAYDDNGMISHIGVDKGICISLTNLWTFRMIYISIRERQWMKMLNF